jgi:hypothetical protein
VRSYPYSFHRIWENEITDPNMTPLRWACSLLNISSLRPCSFSVLLWWMLEEQRSHYGCGLSEWTFGGQANSQLPETKHVAPGCETVVLKSGKAQNLAK